MPKLETLVRRGDVSRVEALIAEFSHKTWRKLPAYSKSYMSFTDLMAAGSDHAVTHVVKMYKGQAYKDAQFITYLYVALENFYSDMITEAYADKRLAVVISADSTIVNHNGRNLSLFDALKRNMRQHIEDTVISRIDAERAFLKVYAQASPHLRKHLINWCIQPSTTKYKLTGSKFVAAKREFKAKSLQDVLTADLVKTIQSDVLCRSQIVLRILRNTKYRTIIKGQQCLEKELIPAVPDPEEREFLDICLV